MKFYTTILFLLLAAVCVNGIYIDENVEKILQNNSNVNVIIKFSDKSEFLKNEFSANAILNNLNKNEFRGRYNKNTNTAGGKISREDFERLTSNVNIDGIYLNHIFKIDLDQSTKMVNSTIVNTLKIKGTNNITGKNLSVCILDTGVNYNLADLGGCFGNGCKVVGGYNFVAPSSEVADDNGHGTHVAGIVAANGSITGVAPEANIVAIKVLNSAGSGTESDIISGIKWCTDNSANFSIKVISMSFGFGIYENNCDASFQLLLNSISEATAKNISVIAASGNRGDSTQIIGNYTAISSPACLSNVTAVSATNKSHSIDNSYSNRNKLVSLLAPGTSIKSLNYNSNTCLCSSGCIGNYMTCSGTSMATPHVAGVYVLLSQYLRDEVNISVNNSYIKELLNSTGIPIIDNKTNLTYTFVSTYKALLNLDTYVPELIINYPENKTYALSNISFNFSSLDANLNSTWYNIDNTNNITVISNTTINLSNGNHIIYLYSNDTNGNSNKTNISFVINTNLPIINLNEPANNMTDIDGNITFNCSSTSIPQLKNISLWHNLSGNFVLNQTSLISGTNNYSLFNLPNINNTKFIWSCLVYNVDEYYAFSNNRSLTVKINNKPNITDYLPSSSSVSVDEGKSLSFNHTTIDIDDDQLTYSWLLDSLLKTNQQNYTYSPNYTEEGTHSISLIAGDNLINTSFNWSLTVNNIIYCGNNIKETNESCDTNDLSGATCTNKGFTGGSLSCSSSCTLITSSCTNSSDSGSSGSGSSGSPSGGGGTQVSSSEFDDNLNTAAPASTAAEIKSEPVKSTPPELVVEESEKAIKIIKGETVNFVFENNNHAITLDNIQEDSVDITINSETVKLTLKLNEEQIVDLEEKSKLKIKLESISNDEVNIKISKTITSSEASSDGKLITGFSVYTEGIKNYGLGAIGLILILLLFRWGIKRKSK